MGKILVHDGKHGNTVIFCLNEEREEEAWLAMFHAIDQWTGYYDRFMDDTQELEWRDAARNGCWQSAKWLLEVRSQNEYEDVRMDSICTPRELLEDLDVKQCHQCKKFLRKEKMRAYPGNILSGDMPGFICKACDPRENNHRV